VCLRRWNNLITNNVFALPRGDVGMIWSDDTEHTGANFTFVSNVVGGGGQNRQTSPFLHIHSECDQHSDTRTTLGSRRP
jgi:hypothetical protein